MIRLQEPHVQLPTHTGVRLHKNRVPAPAGCPKTTSNQCLPGIRGTLGYGDKHPFLGVTIDQHRGWAFCPGTGPCEAPCSQHPTQDGYIHFPINSRVYFLNSLHSFKPPSLANPQLFPQAERAAPFHLTPSVPCKPPSFKVNLLQILINYHYKIYKQIVLN